MVVEWSGVCVRGRERERGGEGRGEEWGGGREEGRGGVAEEGAASLGWRPISSCPSLSFSHCPQGVSGEYWEYLEKCLEDLELLEHI